MCVCAAEAYGTIGLGHSSVKTPGSILPIVSVKLPPNVFDMFVFFVFNISYTAEKKTVSALLLLLYTLVLLWKLVIFHSC